MLSAVLSCALLIPPDEGVAGAQWSVRSGGCRVSWSALRAEAACPVQKTTLFQPEDGEAENVDECGYARHSVLSVVGPVLTYLYHGESFGHGSTALRAVQLADGRPADITLLFDESDVRAALLSERRVRQRVGPAPTASLDELLAIIGSAHQCGFAWTELRTSYGVVRVLDGKAVVRFALPPECYSSPGA